MRIGDAGRADRAEFCIGGVGRAGKGRIYSEWMLAVSRHSWAGVDHDQRGQAPRAGTDALGGVFKLRAFNKPDYAALQRDDSFRRRSRRYLRLPAVDPKTSGREQPAACQALAIMPVPVNAGAAAHVFAHTTGVAMAFA